MEKLPTPTTKETLIRQSVRLFKGALAAGMIAGSANAEVRQENVDDNREKTEQKEKVPYEQEAKWLDSEFNNKSLTIGKPKFRIRSPIAQIGIYNNGEHVDDLRGDRVMVFEFSKDDFIRGVANILDKNKIEYKLSEPTDHTVEVDIEESAVKKLEELKTKGLKCGKIKDAKGNDVLFIQGNEGVDHFDLQIDLKNDHNPDTFVKMDVDEKGHLSIKGKDDGEFAYEIYIQDGDSKITIKDLSPKE